MAAWCCPECGWAPRTSPPYEDSECDNCGCTGGEFIEEDDDEP